MKNKNMNVVAVSYTHLDVYKRQEFNNSVLVKRNQLPVYSGIYAFYENGKPIYVGRANNIRKRICLLYTSRCV